MTDWKQAAIDNPVRKAGDPVPEQVKPLGNPLTFDIWIGSICDTLDMMGAPNYPDSKSQIEEIHHRISWAYFAMVPKTKVKEYER